MGDSSRHALSPIPGLLARLSVFRLRATDIRLRAVLAGSRADRLREGSWHTGRRERDSRHSPRCSRRRVRRPARQAQAHRRDTEHRRHFDARVGRTDANRRCASVARPGRGGRYQRSRGLRQPCAVRLLSAPYRPLCNAERRSAQHNGMAGDQSRESGNRRHHRGFHRRNGNRGHRDCAVHLGRGGVLHGWGDGADSRPRPHGIQGQPVAGAGRWAALHPRRVHGLLSDLDGVRVLAVRVGVHRAHANVSGRCARGRSRPAGRAARLPGGVPGCAAPSS